MVWQLLADEIVAPLLAVTLPSLLPHATLRVAITACRRAVQLQQVDRF
jgi:hypothetical protein